MNRVMPYLVGPPRSVPRRRGDEPDCSRWIDVQFESAPCRRGDEPTAQDAAREADEPIPRRLGGSTVIGLARPAREHPFPAGAGMNRLPGHDSMFQPPQPFPAGAGMNRICNLLAEGCSPFPAGAGMNRALAISAVSGKAVPRRRGDEPCLLAVSMQDEPRVRSPQARG